MATIPEVDLCGLGLRETDSEVDSVQQSAIASRLTSVLSDVGFCFLSNHGLPQSQVTSAMDASRRFFTQTDDVKRQYARPVNGENHGYVGIAVEGLNPERPADYKEAFNFTPCEQVDSRWPDSEVPELRPSLQQFFSSCQRLASRVLHLLALGLQLQDQHFLSDSHKFIGHQGNATTLRTLFYPAVLQGLKPGQIRCGEHSDYGSITLLFQDDIGGLQVEGLDGSWVDATPKPATIVLNIGDALQRWTADKLKATKHRVVVPEAEVGSGRCRQSMAFFVHPDDDVMMECLDGSHKYPPVTSKEYLLQRFAATY